MEDMFQRAVAIIIGCICLVFFSVVGVGLFLQRQWFPVIGAFVVFDTLFFLVAFPLAGVVAAVWFLTRGRYIQVEQFGGYLRVFGRNIALPPLAPGSGGYEHCRSEAQHSPIVPARH